MSRVAVILAGGKSERFGRDKALEPLRDKPMVSYVTEACSEVAEEVVVVVHSSQQREELARLLPTSVRLIMDDVASFPLTRGPLLGLATGFRSVRADYALVLPCDTPLVRAEVLNYLLEKCKGQDAAVPSWPSGYIEPLQAAYRVESALKALEGVAKAGDGSVRSMIKKLEKVFFIPVEELRRFDQELSTFINVNSLKDLQYVLRLLAH